MVNLGLLLNEKLWQSGLLAYDRLLMPPEFWSEKRPGKTRPRTWVPERPPSQVHLAVFYEMVQSSVRSFTTARRYRSPSVS